MILTEGVQIAIISGVFAAVVGLGVKIIEGRNSVRGKDLDDGAERRRELLEEIKRQNLIIEAKDKRIEEMQALLDTARETIGKWAVKYTKLEGNYIAVLEDLQRATGNMSEQVSTVKHELINKISADRLEDELRRMQEKDDPSDISLTP